MESENVSSTSLWLCKTPGYYPYAFISGSEQTHRGLIPGSREVLLFNACDIVAEGHLNIFELQRQRMSYPIAEEDNKAHTT